MITIRQPYNYDTAEASADVAFITTAPSLTQQQFKDETDVNVIVDRFLRTGEMPPTDARAFYGDYINAPDSYQEALALVMAAEDGFNSLSSAIRNRFNNDPNELLSFLQDSKNYDEAVKLGIIEPAPVPEEPVSDISEDPRQGSLEG